jgi:alpha-mannosidase
MGIARFGSVEVNLGPSQALQSQREIQDQVTVNGGKRCFTLALPEVAVCDLLPSATKARVEPILLATRKSCHKAGPWYTQAGDHTFHFVFALHGQEPLAGSRTAAALVRPFRVTISESATAQAFHPSTVRPLPTQGSLLTLDGPGAAQVKVTAFKAAEDGRGYIVRLCELSGTDTTLILRPGFAVSRAERSSLLEETLSPLPVSADGSITISIGHHAIETLRLEGQ